MTTEAENVKDGSTPRDVPKIWSEIKHFSPQEFDSPDLPGSGKGMNIELVKILDKIRESCGIPLQINSGFRTTEHNRKVGGKPESAHTKGCAVDIAVSNSADRFRLINAVVAQGIKRFGIGENFVHIDIDYNLPQNVVWIYPKGTGG